MDTKRQFALGIFFLSALSILAFYTLFLTDFTLFGEPAQEVVYFPEANGLRKGDPVMVSGLRIGRVSELDYEMNAPPERRIRVTLSLNEPIELLSGARISIQESTLLGGRQIDIFPGEYGGPPLAREDDGALYGVVQENPIAALGSLGDLFTENRESVRNILKNMDEIVARTQAGEGVLGKLLSDEQMGEDLSASVTNIRDFTGGMNTGEGLVAALVHDPALAEDLRGTLDNVAKISQDLREGDGLAARLMYDPALADQVTQAFDSFARIGQRMDEGKGVIGRLLSDEELGDEVADMVRSLKDASSDVEYLTANLRNGEGSLGKFLHDDELYDEALTAVRLITRTLEDIRESAPVTTFTGVLFGAF